MNYSNKDCVNKKYLKQAFKDSIKKLTFKTQIKKPVMFVVYISCIITTILSFLSFLEIIKDNPYFVLTITIFLWFTVLFANFAESIAESRGKSQANTLRKAKKNIMAKKLLGVDKYGDFKIVPSSELEKGDIVLVEEEQQIPGDGKVIEGVALVDESAITGESAPVIRESCGDKAFVTGCTTVVSDYLIIKITSNVGENFLDKMIAMVEGPKKKTLNEVSLQMFLIAITIIFTIVIATLYPFSEFVVKQNGGSSESVSIVSLVALLVCVAPTTISALLSSIGIASMSRLHSKNVITSSDMAIEIVGDIDILLLDKTGTITFGNRQAIEFIALSDVNPEELADCSQLSSLADETSEGRSIVILAKKQYALRGRYLGPLEAEFIPFSARTRISGVNTSKDKIRKGAANDIKEFIENLGGSYPKECDDIVSKISKKGGTPLVVCKNQRILGVIYLKDIIKNDICDKFRDLRKMGIKTIMITGDNPLTAATIAAEAGVDDFLAQATPQDKLELIHEYQRKGYLVAMAGDGNNDAPALAQADVSIVMNTGTQAAKEVGTMIDLDSNPTKLVEIVNIGKQLLITKGALTTFSIANDIYIFFAIVPLLFKGICPQLGNLNIMNLSSLQSAIMSTVIYNALVIIALIPLSLRGVNYEEKPVNKLLIRNILLYGVGGIITPFIFIKIIDAFISMIVFI